MPLPGQPDHLGIAAGVLGFQALNADQGHRIRGGFLKVEVVPSVHLDGPYLAIEVDQGLDRLGPGGRLR